MLSISYDKIYNIDAQCYFNNLKNGCDMSDKNPNTKFPTNEFYDNYSSQIHSIKIHLPKSEKDGKYFDFVGRGKLMERLYAWLTNNTSTGSYLVTGFRGMGKTILVNRVMERLTRDVSHRKELLCHSSLVLMLCAVFLFGLQFCFSFDGKYLCPVAITLLIASIVVMAPFLLYCPWKYKIRAFLKRITFPHGFINTKKI